jgi:hypothetical protein
MDIDNMGDNFSDEDYAPPPHPPPAWKHEKPYATDIAKQLQPQGWSVLNLGSHRTFIYGHDRTYLEYPDLWNTIESLFTASKSFFALPQTEKDRYLTKDGSEEGYSSIKGEKEFITLRRNGEEHCPQILRNQAEGAWESIFKVLHETLLGIELNLKLPATSLTRFSEPCLHFDNEKRATMLRLFRYENNEAKTVAEPHMDLGLLSLVIGDTPGLEVLDDANDGSEPWWHPIEQNFEKGMATVMGGRQLQYLTRDRYKPGAHRVFSYGKNTPLIPEDLSKLQLSRTERLKKRLSLTGPKKTTKERYRYSIVFVLRAHEDVEVDYRLLESPGFTFDPKDMTAKTAGELFARIRKAHYNVNIGHEQREEQKRKLLEGQAGTASAPKGQENVGTG